MGKMKGQKEEGRKIVGWERKTQGKNERKRKTKQRGG
jgi:hypothetical protein